MEDKVARVTKAIPYGLLHIIEGSDTATKSTVESFPDKHRGLRCDDPADMRLPLAQPMQETRSGEEILRRQLLADMK